MKSYLRLYVMVFLSLASLPGFAFAANIYVDTNCSLEEAFYSADFDTSVSGCVQGNGSDTIYLNQDHEVNNPITISSNITLKGSGNNVYFKNTTNSPERLFIVAGGNLEVVGVNFINDTHNDNLIIENGGFVLLDHSAFRMKDSSIHGFVASNFGGAIYSGASKIFLENVLFEENKQFPYPSYIFGGGAIYSVQGKVEIRDSVFDKNSSGGQAGSIFLTDISDFIFENSIIEDSVSNHGSAITIMSFDDSSKYKIKNSRISENKSEQGGAVVWRGPAGNLDIYGSLFAKNESGSDGAALELYGTGDVSIINSTFSENHSAGSGSAILNDNNIPGLNSDIAYNTFFGNISDQGLGAVSNFYNGGWSDLSLENNIFSQNAGGDCSFSGNFTQIVNNLSDDGSCGVNSVTNIQTSLSQINSVIGFHRLSFQSNAIDSAIVDPAIVNIPCPVKDQSGVSRPKDGNNDGVFGCDIGASEFVSKNLQVSQSKNIKREHPKKLK